MIRRVIYGKRSDSSYAFEPYPNFISDFDQSAGNANHEDWPLINLNNLVRRDAVDGSWPVEMLLIENSAFVEFNSFSQSEVLYRELSDIHRSSMYVVDGRSDQYVAATYFSPSSSQESSSISIAGYNGLVLCERKGFESFFKRAKDLSVLTELEATVPQFWAQKRDLEKRFVKSVECAKNLPQRNCELALHELWMAFHYNISPPQAWPLDPQELSIVITKTYDLDVDRQTTKTGSPAVEIPFNHLRWDFLKSLVRRWSAHR